MTYAKTSLLAAAWLAASPGAWSADWTQFRGPDGQGHSSRTGLPREWDAASGTNIAWKVEVPGQGWSSPAVTGGTVLLTSAVETGDGLSLHALAFAADDGRALWNTVVFTHPPSDVPGIHRKNSNASPTPLIEGDRVYVHFGHLGTAALTLDGTIVWKTNALRYPPVHGNGGCPVVFENLLIFSGDGAESPFIAALEKDTGEVAWKIARPTDATKTFSFSTPLVIEAAGRTQLVSPGSNVVLSVDPRTGEEIWRVRYDGYSVVPRPVFAHGLVFIGTGYDAPHALAIRPDGTGDVTDTHVAWDVTKHAPNTPSMLVIGDELYMVADNGVASCLDARTGEVHWQERACGPISASPLHADGHIYLQDERGKGAVLKPGKTFEIVATNDVGERVLASTAVGDGCFFIRTESHLLRIAPTNR